ILRESIHEIFFFTSRRRHTSFSRDWSSDVCSSDLQLHMKGFMTSITANPAAMWTLGVAGALVALYTFIQRIWRPMRRFVAMMDRSEERRVGEEGGVRFDATTHNQKKVIELPLR